MKRWPGISESTALSRVALLVALCTVGCSKSNRSSTEASKGPPTPAAKAPTTSSPLGDASAPNTPEPEPDAEPEPALPGDCVALADAVCASYDDCNPAGLSQLYGDVAACKARYAEFCSEVRADGSSFDLEACEVALAAPGCQAFSGLDLPAPCRTALGAEKAGAECGTDSDCASGYCDRKGVCGKCAARPGVGERCAADECALGLFCGPSGECEKARGVGEDCVADTCGRRARCHEGVCVPLGGLGDACDATAPCDALAGLECVSGACAAIVLLEAGASCSAAGARCPLGSTCTAASPLAPATCVATSCGGQTCEPPHYCVEERCSIREASLCN